MTNRMEGFFGMATGKHQEGVPEARIPFDVLGTQIFFMGPSLGGGHLALVPEEPRRTLSGPLLDALFEQIHESLKTAEHATASVDALTVCVRTMNNIANMMVSHSRRTIVPLNALPRSDLQLTRPILVSVEQDDDGSFIAEVDEAGAVGYGETVGEAMDGVAQALCDVFDDVCDASEEELGPRPKRWKAALKHMVQRNG